MKKVVFCIIMAATIFATMEVALKIGGVNLDSFQLTAVRFLIGGLILAPAAYFECRKSGYRLKGKDVAWMALLGIVGIAISMVAFQMGVLRCNAATAAPLFCTNPLYAMVIAHIFTSEKMPEFGTFLNTRILPHAIRNGLNRFLMKSVMKKLPLILVLQLVPSKTVCIRFSTLLELMTASVCWQPTADMR